jgi:hypothetical protein
MAKLLERIRAWRQRKEFPTEPGKDWKTVGKTFRATDTVYDKTLPMRDDDGRPRH